jgi:protein-disulfide isomerase
MTINKLVLGGVAAVLVAAFWIAAVLYQREQPAPAAVTPEPAADVQLVRPYSPTLGPATAAVTVVEFFDPECEACRAMYPIVKQVLSEFDGRVRLVIRYMPLHGNSVYAATLLEGARAQNRYWEFLEVVMFRQPEWASHHAPRPELLMTYVAEAGVDAGLLRAAAEQPEIQERIRQDQADGMALGANRTPTFFINGKPLLELGYPQLRAAMEAELR